MPILISTKGSITSFSTTAGERASRYTRYTNSRHPSFGQAPYPGPVVESSPVGTVVQKRLLRRDGRRVTQAEFDGAAPFLGRLHIQDTRRDRGSKRTYLKEALLRGIGQDLGSMAWVRQPLFDPVVISLESEWFILSGHEIKIIDGVPVQLVQA